MVPLCLSFLVAIPLCALDSPQKPSADDLLRKAVDGELQAQAHDHSHWMYELQTTEAGQSKVKWVVQTTQGDLERLWSINGRPIDSQEQESEDHRIDSVLHERSLQKKRERAQAEDARQMEQLFRMLPDAVVATYGQQKGDLVELRFTPRLGFRPATHEAAVFHAMQGRVWIDTKQNRLVEIEGHLAREVKFYGGLLGHLDEGGEFRVRQSEVAPGHWEVTLLHVNMHGRVLFFKTIAVQQNEIRSSFRPVASTITLAEAAEELQRLCRGQAASNFRSHLRRPSNFAINCIERKKITWLSMNPLRFQGT
jgi:hypothetical protein